MQLLLLEERVCLPSKIHDLGCGMVSDLHWWVKVMRSGSLEYTVMSAPARVGMIVPRIKRMLRASCVTHTSVCACCWLAVEAGHGAADAIHFAQGRTTTMRLHGVGHRARCTSLSPPLTSPAKPDCL